MTHAHAEVARSIRSAAAKTNKHGEPPLPRRGIGGEPPFPRRGIARQASLDILNRLILTQLTKLPIS